MNEKEIIVSGNNLELTDALKSEATSKLSKLFTLDERIIRLRVDLQYDANKHKDNEFIARFKGQTWLSVWPATICINLSICF